MASASTDFRLLMISAMYENGGNTTHRFLDGHPELFVYPFESQLGTQLVRDQLSSMFPVKYRWPVFALDATPAEDYRAIIDEETKVRARTPQVSKFRNWPFELSDDGRLELYIRRVQDSGRSRAANIEAFFRATFDAWKDHRRSGRETMYVGYSPIVIVDGEAILGDLLGGHILHVVRNPWSAYADTKKRPVPLSLESYMLGWSLNQHLALILKRRHPDRVDLVRTEDLLADPGSTLGDVCERLGLARDLALAAPSWNGAPLDEVYPWGTIRTPTPDANRATAEELTPEERVRIAEYASPYLGLLDYGDFLDQELSAAQSGP